MDKRLNGLAMEYGGNLRRAVAMVYGDEDSDVRRRLTANVTKFGVYKAYHVDGAIGRIQASGVDEKERNLQAGAALALAKLRQRTEYNTTVARTRTARQWDHFMGKEQAEAYPNIRWLPSMSATPREEHRVFWGLTLSKDDPFWQQNQPGNLWNCKCDWEETSREASPNAPTTQVKAHVGLNGNPGVTGEVFSGEASYFQDVPSAKHFELYKAAGNIFYGNLNRVCKDRLSDKRVKVREDLPEVAFNARGIGHLVHDCFQSFDASWSRREALPYLDEYIKKGKLVAFEENKKRDKKRHVDFYYYVETEIGGARAYIGLEYSVDPVNGRRLVAYTITSRLRSTAIRL
jgi:hypothetical protein